MPAGSQRVLTKVVLRVLWGWAKPGCVRVAHVALARVYVGSAASQRQQSHTNVGGSLWIVPGPYAPLSHSPRASLVRII